MDTQNRTESAIEVSHIPDAVKQFFEALIIRLVKLVTDTSEHRHTDTHTRVCARPQSTSNQSFTQIFRQLPLLYTLSHTHTYTHTYTHTSRGDGL